MLSSPAASAPAAPWPQRSTLVLRVFGPLLVATGVLGFVVPPHLSLMSGATPYNLFHIAFGLLGTGLVLAKQPRLAAAFNLGFGAIDLYQALAGVLGLFPAQLFALRPGDHAVHVVLGLPLVAIGLLGLRR